MKKKAGSVLILTGPPGAGKSTVARILAETAVGPAVHLHADDFYDYIRKGRVPPFLPESQSQNEVVVGVIAAAAFGYARGGYFVVVDGIVGPWFLAPFRKAAAAHKLALDYAVLRPSEETVLSRARGRAAGTLNDSGPILSLYRQFQDLGALEPHAVDTTRQTPSETADAVLDGVMTGRMKLRR